MTAHTRTVLVPEMEVQDIDSEQDWRLAELKYQIMREKAEGLGAAGNISYTSSDRKSTAIGEGVKTSENISHMPQRESRQAIIEKAGDFKATHHCFLRKAKWEDMEKLFLWANDKEVRKNSFSTAPISYEEHQSWYERNMKEENTQIYIFCDSSFEVGTLRLEFDQEGAKISYSIAPEYRGNGYGQELISLAEQEVCQWAGKRGCLPQKAVIKAQVKPENQASNNIFSKAGYEVHGISYQKIITVQA